MVRLNSTIAVWAASAPKLEVIGSMGTQGQGPRLSLCLGQFALDLWKRLMQLARDKKTGTNTDVTNPSKEAAFVIEVLIRPYER